MGFVRKTPAGTYRAFWRDPAGRQRSKNFPKQKQAKSFLSEVESSVGTSTYVDPTAGKTLFSTLAKSWLEGYDVEPTTYDRAETALDNQVLPTWGATQIGRITHLGVKVWVKELGKRGYAPATVLKALQVMSMILRAGVRSKMIGANPCLGVAVVGAQQSVSPAKAITQDAFMALLADVPRGHRLLPALAGLSGLRWGEAAGIPWSDVDLDGGWITVSQVAVEVSGTVAIRLYPKTAAGRRRVPMPKPLHELLAAAGGPSGGELVCPTSTGQPMRRANFRRSVWRPSLVRAGFLGEVSPVGEGQWEAVWLDDAGQARSKIFDRESDAVRTVARNDSESGLRFHDLRHSYITWLISEGLPVNAVQRLVGHAKASTTLDRYTHVVDDPSDGVRGVFDR